MAIPFWSDVEFNAKSIFKGELNIQNKATFNEIARFNKPLEIGGIDTSQDELTWTIRAYKESISDINGLLIKREDDSGDIVFKVNKFYIKSLGTSAFNGVLDINSNIELRKEWTQIKNNGLWISENAGSNYLTVGSTKIEQDSTITVVDENGKQVILWSPIKGVSIIDKIENKLDNLGFNTGNITSESGYVAPGFNQIHRQGNFCIFSLWIQNIIFTDTDLEDSYHVATIPNNFRPTGIITIRPYIAGTKFIKGKEVDVFSCYTNCTINPDGKIIIHDYLGLGNNETVKFNEFYIANVGYQIVHY